MPEIIKEWYYKEERANALTHGLGIALSLLSIPFLIYRSVENGASPKELFGLGLYGISMTLTYFASTIYHSVHNPETKRNFRRFDHISIYFLIAGTHTPFIFHYLKNTTGMVYLAILWSLAILGTLHKIFFLERWERFSLALYIFMGWMVVFILPDLLPVMHFEVLKWIAIGGFFYCVGVIFFNWKIIRYNHVVWHVFVLGGSAAHYIALWKVFQV